MAAIGYTSSMITSMTGFARGSLEQGGRSYVIEIQSVNRKSFDVYFNTPRELLFAEIPLKKLLAEQIKRGQVTVRLIRQAKSQDDMSQLPQIEEIKSFGAYAQKLATAAGIQEAISLDTVLQLYSQRTAAETIEDEETFLRELTSAFSEVLGKLMEMKRREGETLKADFKARCAELISLVKEIEKQGNGAAGRYEERLRKRLEEFGPLEEVDAERLAKEVALMAERIDIAEELTRLYSHCEQFEGYLESDEERLGRTLEFLLQEMNREVNTIASKSQELILSQHAVSMKSVLDKLREQVQNIE